MDKMMVSDLIRTLLKKKLIFKKRNVADARSFLVEPTLLGEQTTQAAIRKIEKVDSEFFGYCQNLSEFHRNLIAVVTGNVDQ